MSASPEKWRRAGELFDRAADLRASERETLLDAECGDDLELRNMVVQLLGADAQADHLEAGIAPFAESALSEYASLRPGERCGPYRILRLIGLGGMGEVYLAQSEDGTERQVALKLVRAGFATASARRRLIEERRLLARLEHPHIARLYDSGLDASGQPWYAMEYVDGAPLVEWCDRHRLDVRSRMVLFAKICDAVDYAHRQLIVHRDIKPGNVLVDAHGEPHLLDFGIAKSLAGDSVRGDTAFMTPDYAAPEQLRGEPVGTATDIYALGAVLFEVLAGQRPFAEPLGTRDPPSMARALAGRSDELLRRAADRSATLPALRRSLQGDPSRILRTALDPAPAGRYRSAATLAEDLRAVATGRAISLRRDRAYRLRKFVLRHRWAVGAGSVAALGLVAALGMAVHQQRRADERARIATAVKDFVADLLEAPSPEVSLGKELSVGDVLDRGSRGLLSAELGHEPAIALELLTVMARSYASLGDYSAAQALFVQAEPLLPKADLDHRADFYAGRLDLAIKRGDGAQVSRYVSALSPLLDRIEDPGIRVSALLTLAQRGAIDGDPEAVERRALEAVALAKAHLPPGDARRFRALGLRALARYNLDDPQGAVRLYRAALDEGLRRLPSQHPELAALRRGLYMIYVEQGRDAEAEILARQIFASDRQVYGEDSAQAAQALAAIAQTQMRAGLYLQARPLMQRAWLAYQGGTARQRSLQASLQTRLAQIERAAGHYPAAQRWYELSVASFEGSEGAERSLPFMRLNVADMMRKQGLADPAKAIYTDVLRGAPPDGTARALSWLGLGELARDQGNPQQALALHQQAEALLSNNKGVGNSHVLGSKLALARDYIALGRSNDGEKLLVGVVAELDRRFDYQTPELNDAYCELGRLLSARADRRVEAERLLGRCLSLRERMFGAADPRSRQVRAALQALGRG